MTDNGAKALAEIRQRATESIIWNSDEGMPVRVSDALWAAVRDRETLLAILANGAVFLTAEEAERLRRIEAAARDVAPAWDRAVLGAVKGGYGPINAEFGDVADMVKALRAALTDPSP